MILVKSEGQNVTMWLLTILEDSSYTLHEMHNNHKAIEGRVVANCKIITSTTIAINNDTLINYQLDYCVHLPHLHIHHIQTDPDTNTRLLYSTTANTLHTCTLSPTGIITDSFALTLPADIIACRLITHNNIFTLTASCPQTPSSAVIN